MLFLRSIDKLIITTSSASTLDYVVVIGPPYYGEYDGSITSATTTVITPSIIPSGQYGTVASATFLAAGSNTVTFSKRVGTISYTIFKASLSAGDLVTFDGVNWQVLDSTGKLKVTTATGGGGGGADGGNILAAGTQTADSTATVVFQDGNGITFGMDSNTITASYTVPNTTQFQHSSLMTNYLGNTYTSHTHSQYLNLSQSSLLQHTSLMSNYLGTAYTTHTHSQYLNTSQSSLFQHTNAMSDYLGTTYTTHTHSDYVNTSQSSLFQNTSLMSDYLGTIYTSHTHTQLAQAVSASNTSATFQTISFGDSNGLSFYITNGSVVGSYTVPVVSDFLNTSQSSLFQQTSLMSDYLGTSYTTHTHSQSVQTQNMVSVNNSTGAIWFENGNGVTFGGTASTITASYTVPATTNLLQTSQSSLFQQTSQMSDYLGTAYTTHTHSQYLNTSQSSLFQQTSLMSDYLGTAYTTHTHSQYVNTSVTSNFLTTQTVQPVAASATNGSFAFSTLRFVETGGVTFATSTDGIRASVQTNYVHNTNSSLFQQTSLMSDYLGTNYTTHTHSQYLTTARASNDAIGLATAQSNVTWTVNSAGISLDARGYAGVGTSATNASITLNSAGLAISIAAPGAANINLSAGTTSNNLTAFTLSNLNGISFGLNGSVVTASHNGLTSQSIQTQNMVSLLGSTGNISFANGNGITFGGNASTITASHNGLTSQSNQAFSASGGSSAFQTLNFANSNGLTFSNSNGSIIALYTVPTLTNSSMTMQAGTQTLNSVSRVAFGDGNGISFGASTSNNGSITITASHNGLTSQSNQAFSAAGGSSAFQTLNFANSNGITFSNSNGSLIASHNGLTSQSYQPMAFSGSNGSFTASTLSFGNLNGMSFYTSNGSIVASYTDAGAGGGISAVNFSAGTTSGNLTNIVFANSNGISFGLNGSTITASVNAGAGGGVAIANSQTTFSASTVNFSAAGALTIASTTGQSLQFSVPATSSLSATGGLSIFTNGSTISIGVPADITHSGYAPYADLPMVAQTHGAGTLILDPDYMPNLTFDRLVIPMAMSNASNSSGSHTVSFWAGIYTNNAGTLSLLHSASASTAMTMSGTAGSYSLYSGMRIFTMGYSQSVSEGQYWMAFLSRTTSGGANGSYSVMAASQVNSNFVGHFGSSHNTTVQLTKGQGVYTATTNAMPGSINFSQIRGSDSAGMRFPAIMFANSTV